MGNSTGVLDRFYSKLSPFMNPGLHSGRDLRAEKQARMDTLPASPSPVPATDTLEDDEISQAVKANPLTKAPALSAAEKAFDLFDAGKLGEAGLLAALGVSRAGYELSEELRLRALTAFEAERLSEDALTRVLGG
jgi:hypothetical protein